MVVFIGESLFFLKEHLQMRCSLKKGRSFVNMFIDKLQQMTVFVLGVFLVMFLMEGT